MTDLDAVLAEYFGGELLKKFELEREKWEMAIAEKDLLIAEKDLLIAEKNLELAKLRVQLLRIRQSPDTWALKKASQNGIDKGLTPQVLSLEVSSSAQDGEPL